jgi:hypothetical protein
MQLVANPDGLFYTNKKSGIAAALKFNQFME